MARNGSGTYSLPAGNPVVTGTTISSTTHNTTMSDIATALTGSIAKDGQTVITGAIDYNGNEIILDVDGDTSITSDTDDQIDVKIAGADDFQFTANDFKALSGSTFSVDTINESTADNGVTIDSAIIKDGSFLAQNTNAGSLLNEAASDTNPTVVADKNDTDTGIGGDGSDGLSLITGGTQAMDIDSSQRITKPNQPAFLAYNSSTDANQTGNSASFVMVDFDTEAFDRGSNFASDTFTAPVTGLYHLSAQVRFEGITSAADDAEIRIVTSNRIYEHFYQKGNDLPGVFTLSIDTVADMDANDTAHVSVRVRGESSDAVGIFGANNPETYFCGYLVA